MGRSLQQRHLFICDGQDCGANFVLDYENNEHEIWKELNKRGWIVYFDKCLCNACIGELMTDKKLDKTNTKKELLELRELGCRSCGWIFYMKTGCTALYCPNCNYYNVVYNRYIAAEVQ